MALATSFGIDAATFAAILTALGFQADAAGQWSWRTRPKGPRLVKPTKPNAFAALETLRLG
jgi:hypothetical protein